MCPPDDGGNIIDGQALVWLSSRSGVKIWVSDGVVTGVGDRQTTELVDDAKSIVRSGGIVRVTGLDGLKLALKAVENGTFSVAKLSPP